MHDVYADKVAVLNLGYAGEADRTLVHFPFGDLAAEFPGGIVVLQVSRPGENTKHDIMLTTEGTTALWIVSDYDLAIKGDGECQLIYSQGTAICKKKIWKTRIDRSLEGRDESIPPTWQDIEANLIEAAANVQSAIEAGEEVLADMREVERTVEGYKTEAENARDEAVTAQGKAEQAEGSAEAQALKAEGYAVGTQDGAAVESGSPYFENNAEYYAGLAEQSASQAGYMLVHIDDVTGHLIYERTVNVDVDFSLDGDGHLIMEVA